MQKIKISIIVPVYNTEKYLRRCIDSILQQTERAIEVILVDDGSSDESGHICDEYAVKDNRVVVIHQNNAGVSTARNRGIDVANGQYIGFVDADDWIEPVMYSRMLEEAIADDTDIVMCDAVTVYTTEKKEMDTIAQLLKNTNLNKEDLVPELLLEMAGSACRCIYRAGLIKDNRIEFPLDVKFSEDRVFNLYAMGHANKIKYIKEAYYQRLMHAESAVHSFHADYLERIKKSSEAINKAIKEAWGDSSLYYNAYLSQLVGGAITAINNYFYRTSTFSWMERRQAVKAVCEDTDIRKAIHKSGSGGIRGKWILKKRICLLCICAWLANRKHGR